MCFVLFKGTLRKHMSSFYLHSSSFSTSIKDLRMRLYLFLPCLILLSAIFNKKLNTWVLALMLEKWLSIWHGCYPSACFTVSPRLCERTFTQAALGCNSWFAGSFAFKSFKKCVCVCSWCSWLHLVADTLEQSSSELGVPSTTCTVSAACRSYLMAILSQWLKFSRLSRPLCNCNKRTRRRQRRKKCRKMGLRKTGSMMLNETSYNII